MKALTLAAVIALSATGAAALDSYEILTKGVKITEFDNFNDYTKIAHKYMMYAYNGDVYFCVASDGASIISPVYIEKMYVICDLDTTVTQKN